MTESLAIAINSRVRDTIQQWRMEPAGDFSMLFSMRTAQLIKSNVPLAEAIERAIRETGTTFKRVNRGNMQGFKADLVERLGPAVPVPTLQELLGNFKAYAERQLVSGFKKNNNEEFCRSNLQTYLEQAGRTTREVQSGGGLIDVVVRSGEPVEAKLWGGLEYFRAGIEELREYMRTERQKLGYYVVFDTLSQNPNLPDESQLAVPEGRIFQMAVRMNPGQPSTRRRRRRR